MKSINFRVSHQVEELTRQIFNTGGQEFYTEASRTNQALRTTLFEGEGHVRPLYYYCNPLLLLVQPTYYIDVPM